jgi:glutamate racemase
LEYVTEQFNLPVIGVVSSTAEAAAAATVNKKIGIIGTPGTVSSGAYERRIKALDGEIEVLPRACPMFVPLVENGYTDGTAARLIAEDYLTPLKDAGVDTVILGCTHYPLLKGVISDIMGSGTALIDSGAPTARYARDLLEQRGMLACREAEYKYFVSDTVDNFSYYGSLYMRREISGGVSRIDIERY